MPIFGFEIFTNIAKPHMLSFPLRSYSTDWIKHTRKDFKKISGNTLIFGGGIDDFLPLDGTDYIFSINYSYLGVTLLKYILALR